MTHQLTRNVSGHNIDDFIQPICSCGWQGQKHYGYDDYQMTNLQAEEKQHKKQMESWDEIDALLKGNKQ